MTSPSDAPVRTTGTRSRSGNAMLRTRLAILDAAERCIERGGVRTTTMSQVSLQARVAKATLYNHFRTKEDLLVALLQTRVATLAAASGELPTLAAQLAHAGGVLGTSAALRRVAAGEPALLARIGMVGEGRVWEAAREAVTALLTRAGASSDRSAVDLVLRWLAGHAMWTGTPQEVALGARVLALGLGADLPAPAPAATAPAAVAPAVGPGWAAFGEQG